MSLARRPLEAIPEETARVTQTACPKGTLAIRLRDAVGVIYRDEGFAALFPSRGQPAEAPWRLMLVTLLQFAEDLTDRQAAEAVRSRIDWKYALSLELSDPGFDASVLSEFRGRLLDGGPAQTLLDTLLAHLKAQGVLKTRTRQRTDSTHVLAAIRAINRLEVVGETLRAALNSLAVVAPDWLQTHLRPDWATWVERYGSRFTDLRLPKTEAARAAFAATVGADGRRLLRAIYDPAAPTWLREVPAVDLLRQVWLQQFSAPVSSPSPSPASTTAEGSPATVVPTATTATVEPVRWRDARDQPPASQLIQSPYDPDARYATKRETHWTGYKVHLTETCAPDEPHLIVHVETTPATTHDGHVTAKIHRDLAATDLLPAEHVVDQAYVDSELLLTSRATYDVTLVGPVPADQSWQGLAGQGYALADFAVEWDTRTVRCPQRKQSTWWRPTTDRHGDAVIHVDFARADCLPCAARALCTRAATSGRRLTLRPRTQHEALLAARAAQETATFKARYACRAGIEGTLAQGTRTCGLRRARYRGFPKTQLQHVLTAISMNMVRLVAWSTEPTHSHTQTSRFVALAPA